MYQHMLCIVAVAIVLSINILRMVDSTGADTADFWQVVVRKMGISLLLFSD